MSHSEECLLNGTKPDPYDGVAKEEEEPQPQPRRCPVVTRDDSRPRAHVPKGVAYAFLCCLLLNSLVFRMHDGSFAAVEDKLQHHFHISSVLAGLFPTLGMSASILGGFVVAGLVHCVHPYRLLLGGIAVWLLGESVRSFAGSYAMFLAPEIPLGLGNGPIAVLAAPLIVWCAPEGRATTWLTLYGVSATAGVFGGIFAGGWIASATDSVLWPFRVLALAAGVVLAVGTFTPLHPYFVRATLYAEDVVDAAEEGGREGDGDIPTGAVATVEAEAEAELTAEHPTVHDVIGTEVGAKYRIRSAVRSLLLNPQYGLTVLGASAFGFVSSGFFFWGVTFLKREYGMSEGSASSAFSTGSMVTSVGGSLVGSLLLDRSVRLTCRGCSARTAEVALRFCALSALVAFAVAMGTFLVGNKYVFLGGIVVSNLLSNFPSSAVTIAALNSVKRSERTAANAVLSAVNAVLGPIVAPLLVGAVTDAFSFHLAVVALFAWLLWAALFFTVAWWIAHRRLLAPKPPHPVPFLPQDQDDV